ncbi:hypothetical protein D3C71_2201340 [compost metagenome]
MPVLPVSAAKILQINDGNGNFSFLYHQAHYSAVASPVAQIDILKPADLLHGFMLSAGRTKAIS